MFWPKGKAMPKYFLCRMVSNFFVSALLALCAGNSPVPSEFPAQRPVTQSSSELISYIPAWYGQQLVFIADLWYFLGKQWKCKNENVSNRIQTHAPWICVVPFELPRYHILGSMKLGICSECVLVKCLYQSLYPWAKYWTQSWSVTRWMKDDIGKKSIIVTKMRFHSVLDYHVNERILPTIPAFVLGKYPQCLITRSGKCWDMVGILHNIPSIYTGKAWEIFLMSDQTFCTRTSHLHNSSNFPVNSQQFLTIPIVWSDTGKI